MWVSRFAVRTSWPRGSRGKNGATEFLSKTAFHSLTKAKHPTTSVADPGLMKGGFSDDTKILAMVVLTTENGAVAHEARHVGGSWVMPPRKILNFRSSEMISGAIWK